MSLNINVSTRSLNREAALEEAQKEQNRKTLYVGDTALAKSDSILAKKIQAQKQALKGILDQYTIDSDFDQSLEEMTTRRDELADEAKTAQAELATVQEMRKAYQEEHGVTADTPEELIPKDEEYAEAMKQFDEMEKEWANRAESAMMGRAGLGKAIASMETEYAKTHGMVDAMTDAEKLMKETSKEIVGMLKQEAIDHVDEEIQETVDKAKEEAEKKEEQEERLEEAKEAKEEREQQAEAAAQSGKRPEGTAGSIKNKPAEAAGEVSEKILNADDVVRDVQKKVKSILEEENLLEEDLKGISVDALL